MDKAAVLQTAQSLLSHPWVMIPAALLGLYLFFRYLKAFFKVAAFLILFTASVFLFLYAIPKGWIHKL